MNLSFTSGQAAADFINDHGPEFARGQMATAAPLVVSVYEDGTINLSTDGSTSNRPVTFRMAIPTPCAGGPIAWHLYNGLMPLDVAAWHFPALIYSRASQIIEDCGGADSLAARFGADFFAAATASMASVQRYQKTHQKYVLPSHDDVAAELRDTLLAF